MTRLKEQLIILQKNKELELKRLREIIIKRQKENIIRNAKYAHQTIKKIIYENTISKTHFFRTLTAMKKDEK